MVLVIDTHATHISPDEYVLIIFIAKATFTEQMDLFL
jgi:hypothetical protein